jgi:putative ABC transport system permease protein
MHKDTTSLPKWAERFLRAICPHDLHEEIEGDLIQLHNRRRIKSGANKASLLLFLTIIRYCRPGILLRNKLPKARVGYGIARNYFLTSYRHVVRDKINAAFKVAGLTLALFSLLVVVLYLSYQYSFDRYHDGYERIYRVNTQRTENGNVEQFGIAPLGFGPMLEDAFPELEAFARFETSNGGHLRYQDKVVFAGVFGVDSTWFDVFSHEFIKGSRRALARPGSIVLTESLAAKIFGDEDPLGKVLTLNNGKVLYEVTAVVKDSPKNSHLSADAFLLLDRKLDFNAQHIISPVDFVDNSTVMFVKFKEGADPDQFLIRFDKVLDQYVPRQQRRELGFDVLLQPLENIYFDPPLKYEFTRKASMVYLYIFAALGVFLFLISCINYANLSLAGFMHRSREMGVRKVLGGRRSQIIVQVVLDTVSYCAVSFILGLTVLYLAFPKIRQYIEPNLDLSLLSTRSLVAVVLTLLILMVVVASAIPAFRFATNRIQNDLRGVYSYRGKTKFNNSLLLAQFVISIICIGATLTVGNQIKFIHNKDLGIDRRNLMVLTMSEDFTTGKMLALKASLKGIAGVTHVSNSSFRMGGGYWKDWYTVEIDGEQRSLELYEVFSDDELFETLGMKVLQGRAFDAGLKADSGAAFVINETAALALGLEDPVGTKILTHPEEPGKWEGTIVGVVNDINISTLHQKVQPLVMRLPWQTEYPEYFVYVRYNGSAEGIARSIKETYNALQPGYPLEIQYVDDFYNKRYENENRAYATLRFGTAIILLISSLGIFSISIYLSIRKMKEFGIRKVLGATAESITYMHISHFVRIACIAFIIAAPVVVLLMNEWLKSFAYKAGQDAGNLILAAAVTFVLIVLSAGYAAIRAGTMDPVKVIREV